MKWIDEAIEGIKKARIPHRNYERALSASMSATVAAVPGEVVCLTGPSRVGKSKLAADLAKLIVGERSPSRDGLMPVVGVEATNNAAHGHFSTSWFATRILTALEHPFYGARRSDDAWNYKLNERISRTPERFLRTAIETGFINRGTKYFFVDEAQHILHGLPQVKPPHSLREQDTDCGSTYGLCVSRTDSGQDDFARGANA